MLIKLYILSWIVGRGERSAIPHYFDNLSHSFPQPQRDHPATPIRSVLWLYLLPGYGHMHSDFKNENKPLEGHYHLNVTSKFAPYLLHLPGECLIMHLPGECLITKEARPLEPAPECTAIVMWSQPNSTILNMLSWKKYSLNTPEYVSE